MKINFEKTRVILAPETSEETSKLEALWKVLVDCNGFNKKLVPIGEYVPLKNKEGAQFVIEGLKPEEHKYVEVKVGETCQCYCKICNKLVTVEAGSTIPICCGRMMEILD